MSFRRTDVLSKRVERDIDELTKSKGAKSKTTELTNNIQSWSDLPLSLMQKFKEAILADMRDLMVTDIKRANATFELLERSASALTSFDIRSLMTSMVDQQNACSWGIEGDVVELRVKRPWSALLAFGAVTQHPISDVKGAIDRVIKDGGASKPYPYPSLKSIRAGLKEPEITNKKNRLPAGEIDPSECYVDGKKVYVFAGKSLWKILVGEGLIKGANAKMPTTSDSSWIETLYEVMAACPPAEERMVRHIAADWFFFATQMLWDERELAASDEPTLISKYQGIRDKILKLTKKMNAFFPQPKSPYFEVLMTHMSTTSVFWYPWGKPPVYALKNFMVKSNKPELQAEGKAIILQIDAFSKAMARPGMTLESQLTRAIEAHDIDQVKQLVKNGAKTKGTYINEVGIRMDPPLFTALFNDREEIAEFLIANGADIKKDCASRDGSTPLHAAAGFAGNAKMTAALLAAGAPVDAPDHDDATPLHMACLEGRVDCVALLLQAKADIEAQENLGETPMHYAAVRGQVPVIKLLDKHKAKINPKNHNGMTPLHLAAGDGQAQAIILLLKLGADPMIKDKEGRTASDFAMNDKCKRLATGK